MKSIRALPDGRTYNELRALLLLLGWTQPLVFIHLGTRDVMDHAWQCPSCEFVSRSVVTAYLHAEKEH